MPYRPWPSFTPTGFFQFDISYVKNGTGIVINSYRA